MTEEVAKNQGIRSAFSKDVGLEAVVLVVLVLAGSSRQVQSGAKSLNKEYTCSPGFLLVYEVHSTACRDIDMSHYWS